jgi:hypothetical protein
MGESMSEAPQRSHAEKYKIAIEANRRRENISASGGDEVSDWLVHCVLDPDRFP